MSDSEKRGIILDVLSALILLSVMGVLVCFTLSDLSAKQSTPVTHSAASTGRIQVTSAQRINIEPQPINVVTLRDMQTHREYLIIVGGTVISLDSDLSLQEKP